MINDLDIVFLGGVFPKETEKEIFENSISNIQNAANNLQWEIISGLEANLGNGYTVLNSMYIGSYPKRYKKLKINTYDFLYKDGVANGTNVGFFNLTGLKNYSRYSSLKPYLKEWANSNSPKKKIIIAYAMTATFTRLLRYIKKTNSEIITCLIVPDLPEYMNNSNDVSKVYRMLKKVEINIIEKDMEYIDSYVLLTEQMRNALNVEVPSVIVEGISTDLFKTIEPIQQNNNLKTIMYSGGLYEKYGIYDLIKAFSKLPHNNYRLILCGSGDAEEYIKEAQKRDKRIEFKGLLDRSEVLKLQKSSTLLINPRKNNEEYTKYSFPSKTLEYLSSGTPVVSYKLDGIPKEYFNYLYCIESDDVDGIYTTLNNLLMKTNNELREKGRKAKEFVLSEKNSKAQVKKILDMLVHIS